MAPPVDVTQPLGLISGNGLYPATFAAAAGRAGVSKLVVAAFEGETEPEWAQAVDALAWFRVGQLTKMIRFFQREGVSQAVMVGQIAPRHLFDLRPDMRTLLLLARTRQRNAESLFGAIAEELAKEGIHLLLATTFLEEQLASEGHLAGPTPKARLWEDAHFGWEIAKETSRLDIGQSVIVRHGTVLAVEAFEGTNACIERGGALGRGKALLVKVSKPQQDLRFDVPVIGPATLESAAEAGLQAIAVEAGKTLVLAPEEVRELAEKHRISLLGLAAEAANPET
ncbi:MAG: UDP-2,3-diacylglucosamine diphosphatase LpxI [Verrucomicrobiota bacterium]